MVCSALTYTSCFLRDHHYLVFKMMSFEVWEDVWKQVTYKKFPQSTGIKWRHSVHIAYSTLKKSPCRSHGPQHSLIGRSDEAPQIFFTRGKTGRIQPMLCHYNDILFCRCFRKPTLKSQNRADMIL